MAACSPARFGRAEHELWCFLDVVLQMSRLAYCFNSAAVYDSLQQGTPLPSEIRLASQPSGLEEWQVGLSLQRDALALDVS